MADSSFRDGDALASSTIAAPTGSGSVHVQKVQQVAADGTALTSSNGMVVTIADGADATQGAKADAAYTGSGSPTIVALLKGLWSSFFGVASGATDSGNPVKTGGRYNATPPTLTDGQRGDLQLDNRAALQTTIMGAGSSITSASGLFTIAKPITSGGLSIQRLVGATSGVIKGSAGQLYTATLTNSNVATRYLQVYNKATAGTLSTDTPLLTIALPPSATVMIDFAGIGGAFSTGISWQFTTDDVAIPTTAGATTDIHGFVTYK